MFVSLSEETQERLHGLIELDETALGKRKYNKGRRQRTGVVAWLQTILEVDESIGGRVAKRLRANLVDDRSFDTLSSNIQKHVQGSSSLSQMDGRVILGWERFALTLTTL